MLGNTLGFFLNVWKELKTSWEHSENLMGTHQEQQESKKPNPSPKRFVLPFSKGFLIGWHGEKGVLVVSNWQGDQPRLFKIS